ncbi:kinetochore protein NDC80-like protein [Huso huso]|uniref:Kinetochore protein NDC80 n=2 Tax=Acipenseridae TaxID=7900 RepID=A0ABR0ZF06_HUSHU
MTLPAAGQQKSENKSITRKMNRASSSRQSLLPMRVTDNGRMSLATPQSKGPGFGKLNIAKPQSGTKERRTSFFGKRASGAGMSRNSAFGGFGGAEKIKDPRPLHDKSFVQQCIRQLCEYLGENGFPSPVTVKSLQSPTSKEFLKIFSFIYSFLDPTFQMPTSKIEEEIPRILKDLGYPFPISKSSMYSVGAPHTWPQILGGLIWLIDSVKLFDTMREQDLLFPDFSDGGIETEDGIEFNKLFISYTSKSYDRFMQGADTFEEEDAEFFPKLKDLYNVDEAHLESLAEKYKILTDEVERLEKESQQDRLMTKKSEKLKLQTDLQKYQSYRSNLESFKSNLEQKLSAVSEELDGAGLQIEALKQETGRLQHIFENQKFSQADIERINHERNELQQTITNLNKNLAEAEHHMWNEEIALAKSKEAVEAELAKYHTLARKLKLIPASAENACGHDFEIKFTIECGPSRIGHYKNQIHTPLMNMISQVEEEINKLVPQKLSMVETSEQVSSMIADKANDLKLLKEQLRKLDEQLEQELHEAEREEHKWSTELDSLESHKKLLEKKVTDGYDEAVEQLKATRQEYHLVLQETSEERRIVANNLSSILDIVTNHVSFVEKFLQDHHKRVDRDYQEAIKEDTLEQLREIVDKYIHKANSL